MALAEAGAHVVMAARNEEEIGHAAAMIREAGYKAEGIALDVLDQASVISAVRQYGPFDVLFNNAGTNQPTPYLEVTEANFDLIKALLERNASTGKLDPRSVQRLYRYEDHFQDEDWKEAIRLFKKAYTMEGTKAYMQFFWKDIAEDNAWNTVVLNFSSVDADYGSEKEEG